MTWLDELAEQRIQQAMAEGAFDDLPLAGKPLQLDDDSLVPEELRAAYRLLKNANCLPPELSVRAEIKQVEDLLGGLDADGPGRAAARRRLSLLTARLGSRGRAGTPLWVEEVGYRDKVHDRLGRDGKQ